MHSQTQIMTKVGIISIHTKRGPDNFEYEVEVTNKGTIEAMLEAAFEQTNLDNRPLGNQVCSTSAGDIMTLGGKHYLVLNMGYQPLSLEESMQIQKLDSRDTSMGYDWLVKQNLLKPGDKPFDPFNL